MTKAAGEQEEQGREKRWNRSRRHRRSRKASETRGGGGGTGPATPAERTALAPTTEGGDKSDTPTKRQIKGMILSPSLDEPGRGSTTCERKEATESAIASPLTTNEGSSERLFLN